MAGAIRYFVVLRGMAFASHTLATIGFAGAAGAVLFGLNPALGLLIATVDPEDAEAKGLPVAALGIGFLIVLGLAVAVALQIVGVLLVFALLVAPAATAERLVRRPYAALFLGALLALLFTWVGLFIAFYLPYPVSFVISALAFIVYLGVVAGARLASHE